MCRWSSRAALVLLLTASGCVFDTSGVPRTFSPDAPPGDLAQAVEAAADLAADAPCDLSIEALADLTSDQDALQPDQLVPDQLVPDQLVPDQHVPDQFVPDQLVPCDVKYGSVCGFKKCSETATQCTFYYNGGGTCDNICQSHGGTCLKAQGDKSNGCTPDSTEKCQDYHSDGICTCTL
jgi:hypothetical protein